MNHLLKIEVLYIISYDKLKEYNDILFFVVVKFPDSKINKKYFDWRDMHICVYSTSEVPSLFKILILPLLGISCLLRILILASFDISCLFKILIWPPFEIPDLFKILILPLLDISCLLRILILASFGIFYLFKGHSCKIGNVRYGGTSKTQN